MSISIISSYAQLQDWHARQKARTDNLIGSAGDSSAADFSSAFTSVASTYYTSIAAVTAQSVISRTQSQLRSTLSRDQVNLTAGSDAARSAGNAILAQLGMYGVSASAPSSSKAYKAPVNYATGYSYTKTSGAAISYLNSLNLFA